MEAKFFGVALCCPIGSGGLKHIVRADDICVDKIARAVDGPVYVTFGGQMHDRVWFMLGEDPVEGGAVAYVGVLKGVSGAVRHRNYVVETGSIGHCVKVYDLVTVGNGASNDGGTNESCATGNQDFHASLSMLNGLSNPSRPGVAASFSESAGAITDSGHSIPMARSSQRKAPSAFGK